MWSICQLALDPHFLLLPPTQRPPCIQTGLSVNPPAPQSGSWRGPLVTSRSHLLWYLNLEDTHLTWPWGHFTYLLGSSTWYLLPVTGGHTCIYSSPFSCWHHRYMAHMTCSPQFHWLTHRPANTCIRTEERAPHPEKLVMEFKEKTGQIVLTRCKAWPSPETRLNSVHKINSVPQ